MYPGITIFIVSPKTACVTERTINFSFEVNPRPQTARALLYGKDYANAGVDEPGNVQLVVTSEQISAALNECAALVVVADNSPVTATAVPLLLENAPKLERVALLS